MAYMHAELAALGVSYEDEIAILRAGYRAEIEEIASFHDAADAIKGLRHFMADPDVWDLDDL